MGALAGAKVTGQQSVSDMVVDSPANVPDIAAMTEEEQVAYAMQMSLQPGAESDAPSPMETESEKKTEEEDYSEVMNDAAFVQSVLENLPGVDPQSEAIRNAMTSLTKPEDQDKDTDKKDGKK